MRILFITTSYPSKMHPSSGIFIHLLAKYLKDIGHEIKVITPADDEKHGFEIFEGIEIHRVWYAPKCIRLLAQRPGGIPVSIKEKPYLLIVVPFLILFMAIKTAKIGIISDVIHGHWEISAFIYRILNIKKLNKKFLLTLRGENIIHIKNSLVKRLFFKFISKKIHYLTSVDNNLSINIKEVLYNYGIYIPVYTIKNGVDKRFFSLRYPSITYPVN